MKRLLSLCMAFLCIVSVTACSPLKHQIAVTAYPIQFIAQRIAKNRVDVKLLSSGHTIQVANIKSNYADIVSASDAVFYINDLEPYYEIYNEDIRETGIKMVDLSTKSSYYAFKRYDISGSFENSSIESSSYYSGDVFNDVNIYNNDPNVWMDATALIGISENVKDYLVDLYPDDETYFNKNYEKLKQDLAKLDSEYQLLRKNYSSIRFASLTASYGDWQRAYGVGVYPVCLSKFGAIPNSMQLDIIEQRIKNDGVKYIANEVNLNNDMKELYQRLITDLGLIPVDINNASLLNSDQKAEGLNYLDIMYNNLSSLESIGE